jgi:hypothetical protein
MKDTPEVARMRANMLQAGASPVEAEQEIREWREYSDTLRTHCETCDYRSGTGFFADRLEHFIQCEKCVLGEVGWPVNGKTREPSIVEVRHFYTPSFEFVLPPSYES